MSTQDHIKRLEDECESVQGMIDKAREFAQLTGLDKDPEWELRLKIAQLDLDSKRLLLNFLKTSAGVLA